ncbi:uncharacterized protein CLUP02_11180 [Colletotrichum lupini]|uniref:Uncharacterized protein n=1 Tax=Colletotrichum lupini TaxID=145971 RepID=A0A9Q8SY45_9PEZI|nr:uncharacterized protein CLUP02_11180 [Colletotrichum lupini]UQC85681.1 hypothetical protein CLUP02_11180 [Colletotrichum lupini]
MFDEKKKGGWKTRDGERKIRSLIPIKGARSIGYLGAIDISSIFSLGGPWLEPIMGDLPSKFMTEGGHPFPQRSGIQGEPCFTVSGGYKLRESPFIYSGHARLAAPTINNGPRLVNPPPLNPIGNLTRGFVRLRGAGICQTLHNVSHLIPRECCYQFPPRFIGATPTRRDDVDIPWTVHSVLFVDIKERSWSSLGSGPRCTCMLARVRRGHLQVLAISPKLTSSPSNQDKRSSPLINLMGVRGVLIRARSWAKL